MYERLLNKEQKPSFEDLLKHCGASGVLWIELENFLQASYELQKLIRFPYGNKEGWGVKYAHRAKHICDIFAESGAFTVFFRLDNKAINNVEHELNDYSIDVCNSKYPCGDGGWIRYRVTDGSQIKDIKKLIEARRKSQKK